MLEDLSHDKFSRPRFEPSTSHIKNKLMSYNDLRFTIYYLFSDICTVPISWIICSV